MNKKQECFHEELKQLLARYKAELTIEDFGKDWIQDKKIVVNFEYDNLLFEKEGNGETPQLVLGTYENGQSSLQQNNVVGSSYSDADLQDRVNYWLDHYTKYGENHHTNTKESQILDIYWNKILDRVLNELKIEEHEVDPMADRISGLF